MKYLFSLLFTLAFATGFSQSDAIAKVIASLKKGDAVSLSKHFDASVDITTPEEEDVLDKPEATKVVQAFFQANPVTSLTVKHKGTSKMGDEYRICELKSSTGVFRITVFMHKSGNTMVVKQLNIEEN